MNKILMNYAPIFVILFFLAILLIVVQFSKGRKSAVSKGDLVKNNDFIAKNKERLTMLFDQKYKELEPLKHKAITTTIILVICIIASIIINNKYFSIISIGVSGILTIIFFFQYNSKSNTKFTEIVQEVIHDFDKDLHYRPDVGFTSAEYGFCRFPEDCDRFSSEDMIENVNKGFQFADVLVESEYEDKDGNTHYTKVFEGSLAKMYIKDVDCKIFLGGMRKNWLFDSGKFVKIKFENDEFNDLFMAYADDELKAYKILTPDVMEEFVNIKKYSFGDVDIRILNDKLYVRFLSGNGFDSSALSKEQDIENLCQSIAVLEEVMKIMEKVKKIIENKNMD